MWNSLNLQARLLEQHYQFSIDPNFIMVGYCTNKHQMIIFQFMILVSWLLDIEIIFFPFSRNSLPQVHVFLRA